MSSEYSFLVPRVQFKSQFMSIEYSYRVQFMSSEYSFSVPRVQFMCTPVQFLYSLCPTVESTVLYSFCPQSTVYDPRVKFMSRVQFMSIEYS